MVWTSDDRQFFFDVTSRVSLWILPEELKDNPQVEKILENGPLGERESSPCAPHLTAASAVTIRVQESRVPRLQSG